MTMRGGAFAFVAVGRARAAYFLSGRQLRVNLVLHVKTRLSHLRCCDYDFIRATGSRCGLQPCHRRHAWLTEETQRQLQSSKLKNL